ncbi:hypothetical protein GCM10010168_42600 [Actinoplanes ianthinogenes]|uniref:Ig-like domain-containing protein n=1 Tax=Actinoplanes ianthinogenes TaxID=122358 RepID=A0ABN6CCT8_9ACTN|nr:Ig-like domain-containing protein [Actinoplanes ianthinogenes]BCJ43430.1 hypothetical protein Aiant_40870 [Actinoplanes ianthinogenes]GGR20172.1 hypothetical protein GCM10010168_42600 [Actinoplanes ianthinogenes]
MLMVSWTLRTATAVSLAGGLVLAGAVPAVADDPAADVTNPVITSVGLTDGQLVRAVPLFRVTATDDVKVTKVVVTVDTPGDPYANGGCQTSATAGYWICKAVTTTRVRDYYDSTITVQALDAAGNRSAPIVRQVHVDNVAPRMDLTPAPGSSMRSGPVTIEITGVPADITKVEVLDGAFGPVLATLTEAPWSYTWQATDGATQPCFQAFDRVGNISSPCTGYIVDDEEPVITRVDATSMYTTSRVDSGNGWVGGDTGLTPTIDDESPITRTQWRVNGELKSTGSSFSWAAKTIAAPTATVDLQVWDAAGNTASTSFPVNIDRTAPTMVISPAERALVRGTSFVTSLRASDVHGVAYTQFGNQATTSSWVRSGADGPKTLTWLATDSLGNTAEARRTVIVDNTAPGLTVTKRPTNNTKLTKKTTLTAAASDRNGVAKVQLLVNGKVVATDYTAGYHFTLNPKRYGKKFTVQLRAYDKAGNVKYSTKRTYRR